MTEFRSVYKEGDRLILKPKPGLEQIEIGCYAMQINQEKYRGFVEDKTIFVFGKGKSRRGFRAYSDEQILSQFDIVEVDKNAKWHKRLDRAIKAMESSGLWPNILETMKNLTKMTYEDKKAIYELTWEESYRRTVNGDLSVEEFNEAFIKHFGAFMEKYPFVFAKDDEGRWGYHTDYLWELSDCRLRSMYFGKHQNKLIKERIKKALDEKQRFVFNARTSYDTSFEYRPEDGKAWYSEEYKDCGNGHYYLALDHNTALFCEND